MLQDPRVLVLAEGGDGYELRHGVDQLPFEVELEIDGSLCVPEFFRWATGKGRGSLLAYFCPGSRVRAVRTNQAFPSFVPGG
jgi:hypothetical protein